MGHQYRYNIATMEWNIHIIVRKKGTEPKISNKSCSSLYKACCVVAYPSFSLVLVYMCSVSHL